MTTIAMPQEKELINQVNKNWVELTKMLNGEKHSFKFLPTSKGQDPEVEALLTEQQGVWKKTSKGNVENKKSSLEEQGNAYKDGNTQEATSGWKNILDKMNAESKAANEKFVSNLQSSSSNMSPAQQTALQQLAMAAIGPMMGIYSKVLNFLSDAWNAIVSAVESVINAVTGAIKSAVGAIESIF
ncbi:hypothetical protein [Thalassotalea fusca]